MINSSAYFLVVHGSRNVKYGEQLNQLVSKIQTQLHFRGISVPLATAYLELASQPLHQEIIAFATKCAAQGYQSINVFPLFLLSGTHVINDIPEQLCLARANSPLPLELMFHLGSSDHLISLLRSQLDNYKTSERILLAHGTSLARGNEELAKIAQQLNAKVAYWSMEPSLNPVINDLIFAEVDSVAILPYFLFTGKITDTIRAEINYLQSKSNIQIVTLPTLTKMNEFIDVVIQCMGINS